MGSSDSVRASDSDSRNASMMNCWYVNSPEGLLNVCVFYQVLP